MLVLLTGTTLAQGITLLTAPLLTRLYTPEHFGVYGLFLAITAVLIDISAARFEMAIILPPARANAINLLVLSFALSAGTGLATCVPLLLARDAIGRWFNSPDLVPWLWYMPVTVTLAGWFTALGYWNNRNKNFSRTARSQVVRAGFTTATNIGLALTGLQKGGLILGNVIGQAVTTFSLLRKVWREDAVVPEISWKRMREVAAKYRNFPKYSLPSSLVESASGQVPHMLLSLLFGAATLGFFSLATRLVNIPMALIGNSIRDVFRQAASEEFAREGHCVQIFKETFWRLFGLGILPSAAMLCLGPTAFAIVFGEKWRPSGQFVQLMSIMFFLRFISSPLSSMFIIAQKQRLDLLIQTTVFALTICGLVVVSKFAGPKGAVLVFSIIYSLKYCVELLLSYRFSGGFMVSGSLKTNSEQATAISNISQ